MPSVMEGNRRRRARQTGVREAAECAGAADRTGRTAAAGDRQIGFRVPKNVVQ